MPLRTVEDYVKDVRRLLLDRVKPYRYSDMSIVMALNLSLLEGRRLRADLFVTKSGNKVPSYEQVSGAIVPVEEQFRLGFVHGIAWLVLERDDEDVNDARSNAFMNIFHDMLVGVRPSPIQGGTPGPGNAQK